MEDIINHNDLQPPISSREYYWKDLLLIGLFAFLPTAQFVMFQEKYDNEICYYNNKCNHKWHDIDAFNNIISNMPYILLGIVFLLTVRYNYSSRLGCGIHRDQSLYYTMGLCLILIGIYSALYHVCPSPMGFQFDTLFMYIGGAITFLAVYHKRHQDRIPSPFRAYILLGIIYYLNTLSLLHYQTGVGIWAWVVADVVIISALFHGTINLYFADNMPCGLDLFRRIYNGIRDYKNLNLPKLILVLIINVSNITMLLYATLSDAYIFTDWFLSIFILNMIIYFVYYLIQKVLNMEKIKWYIWILIIADIVSLGTAMVFYEHAVSNKFLTHAESNALNEPCVLFDYFDYHDIWHLLSALGLYLFLNVIYFIDEDLKNTPYGEINIF